MRHSVLKAILLSATVLGLAIPVHADDDAGTLTPEKAARVFAAKPILFALRRPRFPDSDLFSAIRTCILPRLSMPAHSAHD